MRNILEWAAVAVGAVVCAVLVSVSIIRMIPVRFDPEAAEFSEDVGGSLEWVVASAWTPEDMPLHATFNLVFPGKAGPVRVMRIDSGQGRNTSDRDFNIVWMATLHGMFLEAYRFDPDGTAEWLDRWNVTLYDSTGCELEAER